MGTKAPNDVKNGIRSHLFRPPSPNGPQSSLAALTGLRFLAAFDVVLYHFARVPLPAFANPIKNVVGAGFVGVSLFFILSGFIMAYTYLAPDGSLRGTSRNFYASRVARIFPAYFLGFLLAAPTDILLSLRANQFTTAALKLVVNGILVLTFLQGWTPYTAWAWNFPAWSVSVEVFFYALFPWLGPRLSRIPASRCLVAAAGLWLVSLLAPTALFLLKGPTGPPQVGDYLQMAVEFTPLLRVPEFAIGILAGRAFVAGRFDRFRNKFSSSIVALLILTVMAFSPHFPHPFLAGGLLTPLFVLLIVTLAGGKGPLAWFLSLPFMIPLGEASYGIYILQIPVSYVLRCPPPHTSARVLLSYCIALVTVALLSFRYIESPLRMRIRRWLSGPERPVIRADMSRSSLVREQDAVEPESSTIRCTEQAEGPVRKTTRRSVIVGASAAAGATAVYTAARFMRGARGLRPIFPADVRWVTTTETAPWQTVTASSQSLLTTIDLTVSLDKGAQPIEGFGGCFNELGWTCLAHLKDDDRESIFRELFAPGVGANFSLCRTPVGANDFSRKWYSYDEAVGDFALDHFSIANDLETLVPFIKLAQRYNPSLRLWASPWSPPSWMKRNGFYAEASQPSDRPSNGIRPEQLGREGVDMFVREDRYYATYANYFGQYIDAYKQQGIGIGMVMTQNEFNSPQPFPSCTWTPESLARFIEYLGPVMSQRGVDVFFGTLERDDPALLDAVLDNQKAAKYIRGVGVQWAGKGALPSIHKAHPGLQIYQSEQECGDGSNNWRHCVYCWDLMKFYFEHGTNAYMYWNLALPIGGESHWGWRQNSLITVDASGGTYHFNHEYYLIKHFSHFVQPGACRLQTDGILVDALAFLNPDRSIAVLVHHGANFQRPINIIFGDREVSGWLEPNSFNTVLIFPESHKAG